MLICPKCGTIGFSSGIICCKTKELICIDCCMMCDYYYKNISGGHGCRYIAENWHDVKTREQIRLNQIQHEIEQKIDKIDYFYQTDRPYISRRIEAEVTRLRYEEQQIKAKMADAV